MKNSELQRIWTNGKGKAVLIDNVEDLVERLLMRETEALIAENSQNIQKAESGKASKKMARFEFGNDDDLEEIEDLTAMNASGGGFHFNKQPEPVSKPLWGDAPSSNAK